MVYEQLEGFFNYEFLYNQMVDNANDGEYIIEIGVWEGRSACYLAEKIKESGKDIKVIAIDPYIYGLVGDQGDANEFHRLEKFRKVLDTNDLSDIVISVVQTSDSAFTWLKDSDFVIAGVFVDGNHSYEYCKRDIENYDKIIKQGGIIAGHDYTPIEWQGVVDAVDEYYGDNKQIKNNIWIVNK